MSPFTSGLYAGLSSSSLTSAPLQSARAPSSTLEGPSGDPSNEPLPSDSDHRMQRMWNDYESVEPYLVPDNTEDTVMDVKVDYSSPISTSRPFQASLVILATSCCS